MNIFNVITLFGGLAMFLYGMRMMSDGMKESSSGAFKYGLGKLTDNMFKAFLLGLVVTALIQSSTATIVITSGLVGAGLLTLRQSLGIIVGANVGTTVTGQIIRLLDIDSSAAGWLQIFKPSTLAPIALIIGIIMIMAPALRNSRKVGSIAIGFGILFSGLLTMTAAVDTLASTGFFESLFSNLGNNPFLGYLTGATVAFILQSSSATVGILQAFSASGALTFNAIYAVIVGIYLGDCVTTAIVCYIGAKADAKRVGIINIIFNLGKTVLVLVVVNILHSVGALDAIWTKVVNSGTIANTNTIFNLACSLVLLPLLTTFEKFSKKIVKDDPVSPNKYKEKLDALNPAFFVTPAIALGSCYELLLTMFYAARDNIGTSLSLFAKFDQAKWQNIQDEEENVDLITDRVSNYLGQLSAHLSIDQHIVIHNQYYELANDFEHLSDLAENISNVAKNMHEKQIRFSPYALNELEILEDLTGETLLYSEQAFKDRDEDAARHIEPLTQVMSELVITMKENHLIRLRKGECGVDVGACYMNILEDLERITGVCSNIGMAVIARIRPALQQEAHSYLSSLRTGIDETFNANYAAAIDTYMGRLNHLDVSS